MKVISIAHCIHVLPSAIPVLLMSWLGTPLARSATSEVIVWGDDWLPGMHPGITNVPANATNLMTITGGDFHALGLRRDGTVVAWGEAVYKHNETNVPVDLANVVGIAGGAGYSLALRGDRSLVLWGEVPSLGGPTSASLPPEATNVVALAPGTGAWHALVLRADGTVVDWGSGSSSLSNAPPSARHIVSIAAGSWDALALRADGRVVAWGEQSTGQTNVPPDATNIVAIAAGEQGYAALRADGTVLTWSGSSRSTVPYMNNAIDIYCAVRPHSSPVPVLVLRRDGTLFSMPPGTPVPRSATNIAAIAGTSDSSIAMVGSGPPVFPGLPVDRTVLRGSCAYFRTLATGALPLSYQWSHNGTNIFGATNPILVINNAQLGEVGAYALTASNALGVTTSSNMLLNVLPLEIIRDLTNQLQCLGSTVTFSVVAESQEPLSYQWVFNGRDISGATDATLTIPNVTTDAIGTYAVVVRNVYGTVTSQTAALNVVPTIVTSAPQNQPIFPGGTASFNISVQAVIPFTYQWRINGSPISGATTSSLVFTNVHSSETGIYDVVIADAYESFSNSAVLCLVPVAVWGSAHQADVPLYLANIAAVATGSHFHLALTTAGTIIGWGNNDYGQATAPPGLKDVIAIAAAKDNGMALRKNGQVVAWGRNSFGETNVPAGLTNVVAIAAGANHCLALVDDGTVVGWGANLYGETNVPAGLTNVVFVAAGLEHSLALKADGTVTAWGCNLEGQCVVPWDLANVTQIAAGGTYSLALKSDDAIVGFGDNYYGQITPPSDLSNVAALTACYAAGGALQADGTVVLWGRNFSGETNVPAGLANVVAIDANDAGDHVIALVGDSPPLIQAPISNPVWNSAGFSLSLPTQCGRVFRLEYKISLTDTDWTPLPLVAGNGAMLNLADTTATGNTTRYYRVRRW